MKRKMMAELIEWKAKPNHKGLIITGSRQIGKTYIIEEFVKTHYAQYLHLDFSLNKSLNDIFKEDIDAKTVYEELNLRYPAFDPTKKDSILFLDEIQMCPNAVFAFKSLASDGRCDVIASGSLLTVEGLRPGDGTETSEETWDPIQSILENNEHVSPMGYRGIKRMYALDFEEYLWALGISENVTSDIREHFASKTPFSETTLNTLNKYFIRYLGIGGMPDVIKKTLTEHVDWDDVNKECERIRRDYAFDVTRFAPKSIRTRVKACIDSIPDQLGKDSRKFMYTTAERTTEDGVDNPGQREYGGPVDWIEGAGMASVCHNITEPVLPFKHSDSLKMYYYDTGILISAFQGSEHDDGLRLRVLRGDTEINAGAILENAVANMIEKCGFPLNYFERNKPMSEEEPGKRDRIEIDFIVDLGGELTAIEVKSGKNRRSGSLKKLRTDPRYTIYPVKRFIKFENGNIRVDEEGVEHYPLFGAAFLNSFYEKPEPPPLPAPLTEVRGPRVSGAVLRRYPGSSGISPGRARCSPPRGGTGRRRSACPCT